MHLAVLCVRLGLPLRVAQPLKRIKRLKGIWWMPWH